MNWKEINQEYVVLAINAWHSGDLQKAERIFKEGMAATNNDGYVALKYGECLASSGRFEDARKTLEIAVERLPKPEYKQQAKEALSRVAEIQREHESKRTLADETEKPRSIGLISCTRRKKDYACTARELYSASDKFRRALNVAEEKYDRTYVVSARHGLVDLKQLLSPYDRSLEDYNESERQAWATFVAACLRAEGINAGQDIFVHANDLYFRYLCDALRGNGLKCTQIDFN